jgi:hypothetical protein
MVQTERPDPDQYFPGRRDRVRKLGDGQHFRAAVGSDDDGLQNQETFLERSFIYRSVKKAARRRPGTG